MMTLFGILACLFIALLVLIKLTEGRAKPLTNEQQAKLGKIFIVLLVVLLVARALDYFIN
jgi:hypothetical protein